MDAPDPIGGYFSLELSARGGARFEGAHGFQSARAAYLALLRSGKPACVWMPWFICDSMMEPLRMSGTRVERYQLTDSLAPADVRMSSDDWFLYVNYFGLCDDHVDDLLRRVPRGQVIVDNAQAFYAKPRSCLATIYSPRKFFGVPDGGYLLADLPVADPQHIDEGSVQRCSHLLIRSVRDPESGYADFIAAERSLAMQEPDGMSRLTSALLRTIDYDDVRSRRRENFSQLHASLGSSNLLPVRLDEDAAPLCYPYRTGLRGLREKLIAARVYVPTYWPEIVRGEDDVPTLERSLAQEILPLPCDQRYGAADMARILRIIELARS